MRFKRIENVVQFELNNKFKWKKLNEDVLNWRLIIRPKLSGIFNEIVTIFYVMLVLYVY